MSEPPRKNVVTVTIAGDVYTIRSEAPPEYTRQCATYLDRMIQEILDQSAMIEAHRAVILAALSLTDQLFKARGEHAALLGRVDEAASRLVRSIEDALASDDLALPR